MSVVVQMVTKEELRELLAPKNDAEWRVYAQCIVPATETWIGLHNNRFVCAWGLIPPTLCSDQAYLWLHTTPELVGNEFLFVRHSQIAVRKMLEEYPVIKGDAVGDERSIRWLRWLGAEFGESTERGIPFRIRKQNG